MTGKTRAVGATIVAVASIKAPVLVRRLVILIAVFVVLIVIPFDITPVRMALLVTAVVMVIVGTAGLGWGSHNQLPNCNKRYCNQNS